MYTLLIREDNTVIASERKNIMHRSSMVDNLRILTDQYYNSNNMKDFQCTMEYVLPISREYTVEVLTPNDELYKEKLDYRLPLDTKITSEVGNVELKFTFTKLEMQEDGTMISRVRKTSSTTINVLPVETWSDYIADSNLDSIAQVMLTLQSKIEEEKAYAEIIATTKADGIAKDEDTNEIYLTAEGKKIGKGVIDSQCDGDCGTGGQGAIIVEI